jgi:hypothetical protein
MKIYQYKSKRFGFQMSIPDGWSGSLMKDLVDHMPEAGQNLSDSTAKVSDSRTVLGPDGKYLHILITPLLKNEHEPAINETEEYFDGFSHRQNLIVIATGTIHIANKEHFWATYYRMTIIGLGQIQFYKKYCIYLNRVEYLLTAGLYSVTSGEKLPTDQMLEDSEKVFDEIVSSLELKIG